MKNYLNTTDLAIWIALIAGQVILCVAIIKRRVLRRLPWFSAYIFVSTAESLLLWAVAFFASYATYYYIFYVTGYMVSAFAFLTLIEFGRQVLPGLNLPQREKALAWLLAAIAVVVVFAATWPLRFVANEKRMALGACLAIAVAFIVIAGYSRYLGLRWSRLLGGVAFTLGLLYLVEGVTRAVTGHYPSSVALPFRQFTQIANVLAVVAWTIVVVSPWGEREMTEEDLLKFQKIIGAIEDNFRRFAAGGSKQA